MPISIVVFLLIAIIILFVADINNNPILNSRLSTYYNVFYAETTVEHEFSSSVESVWKALLSFENYNIWFPGINRLLPVVDNGRYVHSFSFEQFTPEAGAYIRLRNRSLGPLLKSKILEVDKNKQLLLEMKFNPLYKERVSFELKDKGQTTELSCVRSSRGLFSFLTVWGFSGKKSRLLENLGYFIPAEKVKEAEKTSAEAQAETSLSPAFIIARAVQAGLDGNMEMVNAIEYKPTRAMAKAALVKIKRADGKLPVEMEKTLSEGPGKSDAVEIKTDSSTPDNSLNSHDLVAYSVNEFLDGNEDAVNNLTDRVVRGKAKALLVKIKRGNITRPPRPDMPSSVSPSSTPPAETESEAELIERLTASGIGGNMDEVNALESRVLRGKIKAAIVKAKRSGS